MNNKWLSSCPQAESFTVNKNNTQYYIQYYQTKNAVSKVNGDWNNIKKTVKTLEGQINELKDAIDSEDYRAQTEGLIQAMDAAIEAIDGNFVKLFTAVVARMNAAAETDQWFSKTASMYAKYVATAILGLNGAESVGANREAYAGNTPAVESTPTADDLAAQIAAQSDPTQTAPQTETKTGATTEKAGFWGRVGATLGTFASGFVEGIVNVGEMAVDAVTIGTAALLTPFTAVADAVGAVSSAITGTEFKSATAEVWKDTAAFVSKDYSTEWFDSYYNNTKLGQTLKQNSYAFDFTRAAGKFTGEMATFNTAANAIRGVTTGARIINGGANGAAALNPVSPVPSLPSGSNAASALSNAASSVPSVSNAGSAASKALSMSNAGSAASKALSMSNAGSAGSALSNAASAGTALSNAGSAGSALSNAASASSALSNATSASTAFVNSSQVYDLLDVAGNVVYTGVM